MSINLLDFNFNLQIPSAVCSAGADVLSQAQDEASVLYEASSSGEPAVIKLLLEYGADANEAKHTGHMPIHRVAHRGHLQYSFFFSDTKTICLCTGGFCDCVCVHV